MNNLKKEIEELLYQKAPSFEIAKLIREDIKEYYKTLPEVFAQSGGKDFLVKHTRKIDSIIKLAYQIATREMFGQYFPTKNVIPLTITALGSYAREQLSPKSDIDIMFIYKDIAGYNTVEIIEKIYYLLLDAGLKLGHRVHEINELQEASKSDITIKTAILESRFLDGSKHLWFEAENRLNLIRKENQKEFIEAKIQERRELRAKYPLMMEPNLKEGVGGFRDANLVYWIGKLLYNVPRIKEIPPSIIAEKDYIKFRIALEFLFRVRSALHLSVKRKTDQLRLEYIPEVAKLLGYKDTAQSQLLFAKKVNKSLRTIWLYSRIWIDALTKDIAPIYQNYLKPNKEFKSSTELIKFLIKNANQPFQSHPTLNLALLNTTKTDNKKERYQLVKKIFKAKYTSSILIALSEAGKLGHYISPLRKVEALPQFDGYHKYTVDNHSIKCVEALENMQDEKLLTIYNQLPEAKKILLKMVILLHDAGKGRTTDHHIIGAKLFKSYAKKLELSQEDTQIGYNIILHHDKLSQIAQKEDIYNSKSIAKLCAYFPSKLELDMIYLLTYADTNGVGSDIYNNFTAKLFATLYNHSIEFLKHKKYLNDIGKRVQRVQKIERASKFKELPKTVQRKILSIESNLPFIKYTLERIIEITKKAIELKDDYIYTISNDKFLTIEIIRKKKLNLGYLLAKLSNLNVVNIDIVKLFDNKKYFKIDFNQQATNVDIQEINHIIEQSFNIEENLKLQKPQIKKDELKIDCNHSTDYALLELNTSNQKALLAYIMTLFEELEIEIVSSKTFTHKKRVNDIFLIDKNGNFCSNLEYIKKRLTS